MKAVAVTVEEGGVWQSFPFERNADKAPGNVVHAIAFDNGDVWDAFSGFRPRPVAHCHPDKNGADAS